MVLPADMFVRGRTAAEIYQNPSAYMTGLGPVWGRYLQGHNNW